jgi:protein phosphatase
VNFDDVLPVSRDPFPPLSAIVRAEFAAKSWRAPAATTNTDQYLVIRLARTQETLLSTLPPDAIGRSFEEQAYAMVIADGLGPAGELASRLTVAGLLKLALAHGQWRLRVDDLVAREVVDKLTEFYRRLDAGLVMANRAEPAGLLHTTLTAVVTSGRDLFFAHVGHSRAYLLREGALIQITHDQAQAAPMSPDDPRVSSPQSIAADLHHVLTNALGAEAIDPHIEVERLSLSHDDCVLLCTNGLTDVVADPDIAEVLGSSKTLGEQAADLVSLAVERGCSDDVTAVIARYHIPE